MAVGKPLIFEQSPLKDRALCYILLGKIKTVRQILRARPSLKIGKVLSHSERFLLLLIIECLAFAVNHFLIVFH